MSVGATNIARVHMTTWFNLKVPFQVVLAGPCHKQL